MRLWVAFFKQRFPTDGNREFQTKKERQVQNNCKTKQLIYNRIEEKNVEAKVNFYIA